MHRRLKKSTRQFITAAAAAGIFLGASGGGCLYAVKKAQLQAAQEVASAQQELERCRLYVYEAIVPLRRGDIVSPENTARVPAYSTMDGRMFLTGDDLGSRLLVDVAEGVQLLKAMVSEDSAEDLREVECEAIVLNHNRREHDIVDVRIRFPNGEDYIVLSKKELYRLEDEVKDRCYLQCAEEEIALLSGAYVDAWIYQGARLYTARYVQPALQEQAVVTYVPSADAIEAMSRNPNIKEKAVRELMLRNRSSLEERLAVSEVSGKTVSSWEDAALEGGNVGGYDEISDWEE